MYHVIINISLMKEIHLHKTYFDCNNFNGINDGVRNIRWMVFNSMALLADGWHMSSHMLALGLAYFAYRAARHYSKDRRFSFGTWKIEILAGYSSAILLMVVAILWRFSRYNVYLIQLKFL